MPSGIVQFQKITGVDAERLVENEPGIPTNPLVENGFDNGGFFKLDQHSK
jgi:hypothetical protein